MTLLRDSQYWQGLFLLDSFDEFNENQAKNEESIRAPLLGTALSPQAARAIAANLGTEFSVPKGKKRIRILNFPFLKIDHLANEYALNQSRHVVLEIGRAVQQECRDRSRMPSSA
eukprot:TRINITY_DN71049_c0_g1_i1.p1 TRINITY_DN71049_c0_g1~~TRINITY_DN71049_c0_g1_i1.p1  ORF type:complete len:124 (-),score=23.92 TRINITY_DN71049_c0_g1_i1:10-354(-)